jgi:hypothetical protein
VFEPRTSFNLSFLLCLLSQMALGQATVDPKIDAAERASIAT